NRPQQVLPFLPRPILPQLSAVATSPRPGPAALLALPPVVFLKAGLRPLARGKCRSPKPKMNANNTLVNVDGVEKVFHRGSEDIHVLADLHLKVPKGEFLALMGPSGSGKSTLLNLIGGLDRPTRGTVSIADERVDELSDRKLAAWRARHVGFVFQLYNLMPTLTAERNVELPLLLTHLSKGERKKHVETALTIVGLSHRLKHYPRTLSGGEQQRVGIALAI